MSMQIPLDSRRGHRVLEAETACPSCPYEPSDMGAGN